MARPDAAPGSDQGATRPDPAPGAPLGAPLEAGALLEGTYRVREMLSRGSMGAVYRVQHVRLGKEFAAKVVRAHVDDGGQSEARLRNEARILAAMDHENIVGVSHLGRLDGGGLFVVMDLLHGEDLRARLSRQRERGETPWLADEEVRRIVASILSALDAAHRRGVVHRDLKPANVFLASRPGRDPVVKLVDFGIGKRLDPDGPGVRLTRTGQIVGTPLYMAPEQMRGASAADPRADLYALGVMLFEMICARPPFEADHLHELVLKSATEPPPDPRTLRPDVPDGVAELVLRSLEKRPEGRFATAGDMASAWAQAWDRRARAATFAAGGHAPASPPPASPRLLDATLPNLDAAALGETMEADAGVESGPAPAPPSTSRSRPRAVALAVALVSVLLALGIAFRGPDDAASVDVPPLAPSAAARGEPDPGATVPDVAERAGVGVPPEAPPTSGGAATRTHRVRSDPSGAEVRVDGHLEGTTPLVLSVPADARVALEISAPRRRKLTRMLGPDDPSELELVLEPLRRGSGTDRRSSYPDLMPR